MRVMRLDDGGPRPALAAAEMPRPEPGPDQVLVRVRAAGVTRAELEWYPTTHTREGGPRRNAVPTHEFSGVVERVGDGVAGVQPGQEVFGMNDWYAEGALAEYCLAAPAGLASKPARLTHVQAASAPIGGLTAWQGLFDRAKLQAGERVLVHGGAGGVGLFAVQLARGRGAHVTATASGANAGFVSGLGAERVLDYEKTRFEEEIAEVDVVFDCVGGDTQERSWAVLSPRGRLVTIASAAEGTNDPRLRLAFFIVEPRREQLTQIAAMLDDGRLRTVVDAVVPLEAAEAAYRGAVSPRLGRGKVVVEVATRPSR